MDDRDTTYLNECLLDAMMAARGALENAGKAAECLLRNGGTMTHPVLVSHGKLVDHAEYLRRCLTRLATSPSPTSTASISPTTPAT
jgi:hypothetical protein